MSAFRRSSAALLLSALLAAACAEPDTRVETSSEGTAGAAPAGNFPGRSYERNFVFTTVTGDSTFLVPWMLETTTRPGTVLRRIDAWIARGGVWEPFLAERWETPPTRTPQRVLPHGSFRIVVREGDAVDGLLFQDDPRNLEVGLGGVLTQWDGPRGQVFQLLEGSLYLADQRLGGLVLDMARGSSADSPRGGDWAFLASGDSLQLLLEGTAPHDPSQPPNYLAWARLDLRELQWTDLEVTWTMTSAFHPARRDVPVAWSISSTDGDLEGTLEVESSQVTAGEGEGPVLPVKALYEVSGVLAVEGRSLAVRGIFVHEVR